MNRSRVTRLFVGYAVVAALWVVLLGTMWIHDSFRTFPQRQPTREELIDQEFLRSLGPLHPEDSEVLNRVNLFVEHQKEFPADAQAFSFLIEQAVSSLQMVAKHWLAYEVIDFEVDADGYRRGVGSIDRSGTIGRRGRSRRDDLRGCQWSPSVCPDKVTSRPMRMARKIWPMSASTTARLRAPSPMGVISPYPSVVSVTKLK